MKKATIMENLQTIATKNENFECEKSIFSQKIYTYLLDKCMDTKYDLNFRRKKMKEKIELISNEIWELKPKTVFRFIDYFIKYEIPRQNMFDCYDAIMDNLEGWISVAKEHRNLIEGLPYNIPHVRNEKRINVSSINKEGIQFIINVLENEKPYEEIPPRVENGMIVIGYVSYNRRIMRLFRYMPFYDKDYNKDIEKIANKDISKLNVEEVKQYLTYIYRKDRFIEGTIKYYIDNGVLVRLLKRFLEIC